MELICIVLFIILVFAMIIAIELFSVLYFQTWVDTLPTDKEKEEAWRDYDWLMTAKDDAERQSIMQVIMERKRDEKTGNR